jgi:hypothetical protein
MDDRGSIPGRAMMGFFSLHHRVQTGSGAPPPRFLSNGYWGGGGLFDGVKSDRGVKFTTHLHLVPRLRMRGATLPLTQYVLMA